MSLLHEINVNLLCLILFGLIFHIIFSPFSVWRNKITIVALSLLSDEFAGKFLSSANLRENFHWFIFGFLNWILHLILMNVPARFHIILLLYPNFSVCFVLYRSLFVFPVSDAVHVMKCVCFCNSSSVFYLHFICARPAKFKFRHRSSAWYMHHLTINISLHSIRFSKLKSLNCGIFNIR